MDQNVITEPAINIFKTPIHAQNDSNDHMDDESEFLFDKNIMNYIEGLKQKYDLEGDIEPDVFLSKIESELKDGTQTSKQRAALEELKKGLQDEVLNEPITLDSDQDLDDSEDGDELTPEEEQFLLMHQLQNNPDAFSQNYKTDLKLALAQHYPVNQVEDYDEDISAQALNNPDLTQFDFNKPSVKIYPSQLNIPNSKPDVENKRIFNLAESENDSKESTSKTPCFIGTPTSNSQLGSINGMGAVRAEDLINAMKHNETEAKRYIHFSSSNNSSSGKLN